MKVGENVRGMRRGLCGLALLGALACSGKQPAADSSSGVAKPSKSPPQAAPAQPAPVRLVDAQGRLIPSGRHLDWLELPLGFEEDPQRSSPRHHVFEAHGVTLEQTRDYLNQRMLTGSVQELPTRVAYYGVIPLQAVPDPMRYSVRIDVLDPGGGVRLTLDELAFRNAHTLSEDQAKQVLAKERAAAE